MRLNFAPRGILQFDEAKFVFPNFEGRGDNFNRDGDRNFSIRIPDRLLSDDEIDNIVRMDRHVETFVDDKNTNVLVINDTEVRTVADALMAYGWNVKIKPPRTPEEEPFIYLKVNVKFNERGPAIYLVSNNKSIRLNEDTVRCLDKIDILYANLDIRPYDWEMRGNSGRTAYLQGAEIYQNIDRFTAKHERDNGFDYED